MIKSTLLLCALALVSSLSLAQDMRVKDMLKIQTIAASSQAYSDLKLKIDSSIESFKDESSLEIEDWEDKDWDELIDRVIDAQTNHIIKLETNRKRRSIIQKVKDAVRGTLKDSVHSMRVQGRVNGTGVLVTFVSSTILGYAATITSYSLGMVQLGTFLTTYPIGSTVTAAALGVSKLFKSIEKKRAFNRGESFNYYREYKRIQKEVNQQLNIKKKDLLYTTGSGTSFSIKKNTLVRKLGSLFRLGQSKLTLVNLIRSLKKHKLYNQKIKEIRNSKDLEHEEKVVFIINYVTSDFKKEDQEKVLSPFKNKTKILKVKNISKISLWAKRVSSITHIDQLVIKLRNAPSGISFLTLISLYEEYILPTLAESIRNTRFRVFKCLKTGLVKYRAYGHKNPTQRWEENFNVKEKFLGSLEACAN